MSNIYKIDILQLSCTIYRYGGTYWNSQWRIFSKLENPCFNNLGWTSACVAYKVIFDNINIIYYVSSWYIRIHIIVKSIHSTSIGVARIDIILLTCYIRYSKWSPTIVLSPLLRVQIRKRFIYTYTHIFICFFFVIFLHIFIF